MAKDKNIKSNIYFWGGGHKTSLFKPPVATSLALALGVSVAIATPEFYTQDAGGVKGTPIQNPSNLTYGTVAIDGQSYATFQFNGTVDNEFKLYVHGTSLSWDANGFGGKGQLNAPVNSILISTQGIAMIDGGNNVGTLTLDMWTGKNSADRTNKFILDLSGVSSSYALYGNLDITGSNGGTSADYATKTIDANFGGKGIKGNVTFSSLGNSIFKFVGDAKIEGNVTVKSSGSITFKNLTSVTGNVILQGGTRTINFQDSNGSTTSIPTLATSINLQGGSTTINNLLNLTGNISVSNSATLALSNTNVSGNISFTNTGGSNLDTSILNVRSINNISVEGGSYNLARKKLKITFSNDAKVYGNINAKHKSINELFFTGNATLKTYANEAINVTTTRPNSGLGNYSKNALIFGGNADIKIGDLSSIGDIGYGIAVGDTYNFLSFNGSNTNNAVINQISSNSSYTIIGKNIATNSSSTITYDSNLFVSGDYRGQRFNGSISEFIKDTHSVGGNFIIGNASGNVANAIVANSKAGNYININGATTIQGNILLSNKKSEDRGNNIIVLTGTSANIGANNRAISVKIDNSSNGGGYRSYGSNTLLLGAATNNLYLSELKVVGDYGSTNPIPKTFNALSFNASDNESRSIASITSTNGSNIVGKDLVTQAIGYNSTLFGDGTPTIQDGFATAFMSNTFTASGIYTLGTITANGGGTNYINVNSITISGNISASGGNNYIYGNGTSSIMGGISASGSSSNIITLNGTTNTISGAISSSSNNYITLNGSTSNSIGGNITSSLGNNQIALKSGVNSITGNIQSGSSGSGYVDIGRYNNIVFGGTSASLGSDSQSVSVKANNAGANGYDVSSLNTIVFEATTNKVYLSELSTNARNVTTSKLNFNALSFNGTDSGEKRLETISATRGNNIIGKNIATSTAGGTQYANLYYNSNLFDVGNFSINQNTFTRYGIGLKDSFATTFMTDTYTASGAYTLGTITANGGGTNYININNFTANTITANGGDNNIVFGANSEVLGNITKSGNGANNFTFTGDGSTLTLKGGTNQISTLTAFTSASSGDTLTLDTTTNSNVVARVDTLSNGDKLNIAFNGGASKSTKLTLNTTNATALKSVNVSDGTNNALVLGGTGTTEIKEAVTISANQGITFDLSSGSSLTLDAGLSTEANGSTIFNLGGENTLAGTLTNNGTHSFVVRKNATLKYNDGLSFSEGANNITFDTDNKTLSWQNANGESKDITTSGTATTTIKFNSNNGVLNTGVNTTAGTSMITIAENKSGTIKGNISDNNTIVFGGGTAKLTLQGSDNTLSSVTANDTGILSLDGAGSQSGAKATITTLTGNNLTANFNGTQSKKAELVLQDSEKTLAEVTLENNSTNNTLALSSGKTTITGAVNVGANQGIAFDLANDVELSFGGGMSGGGASVVNVASNGSAILSGGQITLKTANLSGDNSSTLTLKSQSIDITTINANATTNNTLKLDSSDNSVNATLHTIAGNLNVEFNSNTYNSTLNLNGGTIQSVNVASGSKNTAIFSSGNNIINTTIDNTSVANGNGLTLQVNAGATLHAQGGIDNSNNAGAINVALNGGTLTFGTNTNKLSSLSGNGGKVDLANDVSIKTANLRSNMPARKTLTIDNYTSEGTTFNLFVSQSQNDQIILTNGTSGAKAILTLKGGEDVKNIIYSNHINANNTLVAQANNNIIVESGKSLIGITDVVMDLITENDGNTTKYYIGEVRDLGVDPVFQEVASTALTVNYDLFLANFNSLNKRMGELRDNDKNQGVWARIFGGNMSNDFGVGSKTNYITAQAGYDYALNINDAKNYIGIAVAYGTSDTKSNSLSLNTSGSPINSIALDKVNSNMVEVGVYNSYVADSGWYNDTIFKFDYIMSEFSLSNNPSHMSKTNNFAMVLSDEFGYRYKFGENEKGNWYIDPQAEFAFGYFNQSDFNREIFANSASDLQAHQDAVLTLRSRIGATLGKKFITDKGFVSLYFGASYEYDYIDGGVSNANGGGSSVVTQLDKIESNGRAILNVGSNIELTKGARLYIDVEKSFGDKQRTFMQFNLGARYSF